MIRNSAGFTFIELVIAVSIIALTLAFSGPSLEHFGRVQKAKGASRQIYSMLQRARLAAINENVTVMADFTEHDEDADNRGKLSIAFPESAGPTVLDLSLDNDLRGTYIEKKGASIDVTFQPDGSADHNQSLIVRHLDDTSIAYSVWVLKGGGIRLAKEGS